MFKKYYQRARKSRPMLAENKHIAAVLTYIRNTWGNKASPVKPEQVAAARKNAHPGPMASAELLQIPVQ
jgi:hypothetical protein